MTKARIKELKYKISPVKHRLPKFSQSLIKINGA